MNLKKPTLLTKKKLDHLFISICCYDEILSQIERSIVESEKITVGCINVYYFLESRKNQLITNLYNSIEILHPDGIGVRFALRLLYGWDIIKEKITGTDLYYRILQQANEKHWSLFLFGDSPEVIQKAKEVIENDYPNVLVAGIHHGYVSIKNTEIVDQINASNSNILFLGLGLPKQEYWMNNERSKINVQVCVSVGGGIAFISKVRKRASLVVRKFNLEWVYRLFQDPLRLWKRYIFGIPYFIYLIIRQKIKLII